MSRSPPLYSPFADSVKMDSNSFTGLSALSDDQITNMLVNENGVQLNSELMSQFNVTPKLLAKLLLALCEHTEGQETSSNTSSNQQSQSSATSLQAQRNEEIDTLANLCREFLPSASPLTEILQAIDSDAFINTNSKIINNKHFGKVNAAFNRFWQFCSNLCNTEKQGTIFFGRLWSHNLEFQLGFILNCVRNQLVAKLLSAGPGPGPGPGGGGVSCSSGTTGGSNVACDLSQLVPHLESLKCQPDFESNPELSNWKYQRLYTIIMEISDANSSNKQSVTMGSIFYNQIIDLFKWPVHNCPDLVALGLLGCGSVSSICKNDILKMTIPAFLSNHPNAAIILHTIWSTNEQAGVNNSALTGGGTGSGASVIGVPGTGTAGNLQQGGGPNHWAKQVLLQSMCEYYMKSPQEEQQQRLSRILDVAQDLKALSLLLNSNCHPFVIDLACLASRREYLKLDKWLTDKMESHGEPFVKACIYFLNRRCSPLASGNRGVDVGPASAAPTLPPETIAAILATLNNFLHNSNNSAPLSPNQPISRELKETILTMVANSSYLLQKAPRQAPPGVISNSVNPRAPLPSVTPASLNDLNDRIGSLTLPGSNSFNNQTRQPSSTLPNLATSTVTPIVSTAPIITPQQPQQPVGPKSQKAQQQLHLTHPAPQQPPSQQRGTVSSSILTMFPDSSPPNPEIEKEADTYFQRIYNQSTAGSMTIDEVLEMLRRFSESSNPREKEICQCMIRNLFKEYCYFPQYPEKELITTAKLFGGLIQLGLIKYMALVGGLRCVLEALKHKHGTKMYYFGIAALDRFKERLKEYPLYCQHLTTNPHFEKFPPHLIEYIQYGCHNEDPPSARISNISDQRPSSSVISRSPSPGALNQSLPGLFNQSTNLNSDSNALPSFAMMPSIFTPQSQHDTIGRALGSQQPAAGPIGSQLPQSKLFPSLSGNLASVSKSTTSTIVTSASVITTSSASRSGPSIANATNIDTLLAAGDPHYQTPPESIQDKVGFIINNLSQMNLSDKTEEFKVLIGNDDTYYGWIAQYFVQRRASIEHNFHTLYANFLDMLRLSDLHKLVIKETFRNIKVLLRSDKGIANFSDRSLLKNLGHWLGMLTLAKSKPILSIDLNIKFLLIEAYQKGTQELLYVVPFIAKILESCAKSTVFKPPNPWTMGIVKALVELHQEPNIKLNLRFEVEVLCRNLNVDINELFGKSIVLKDQHLVSKVLQEQQLGPLIGGDSSFPQSSIIRSTIGDHQPPSVMSQTIPGQIHPSQAQSMSQPLPISLSAPNQTGLTHGIQVMKPSPPHLLNPRLSSPMVQPSLVVGPQSTGHSLLPNASPTTMSIGAHHMSTGAGLPMMPPTSVSAGPAGGAQFNYHEISTNSTSGLFPHIVVPNNLSLLQHHPTLKPWIKAAIERAVQEWVTPVVEKANKIALTTAERLIKKDFALEPDENRMCLAAQYLIRSLTAGMAYITSKEALLATLTQSLIAAFTRQLGPTSGVSKELIEETAVNIANSNINLAVCFIQKTAIEKAIPELDKRLATEYEIRRSARLDGRRYCDTNSLKYQAERMPEAIRLKVGSVPPHQFAVYEDIGRNIPGFNGPINDQSNMGMASTFNNSMPNLSGLIGSAGPSPVPNLGIGQTFLKSLSSGLPVSMSSMPPLTPSNANTANLNVQPSLVPPLPISNQFADANSNSIDASLQSLYDKLVAELEGLFHQFVNSMQPNVLITTMHSVLELVNASRSNPTNTHSAANLIQRVLEALNEIIISIDSGVAEVLLLSRAKDLYLVILKALADPRVYGHPWTTKQITKVILGRLLHNQSQPPLPDELFDIFMRSELISIPMLDVSMAQLIENSNSPVSLAFALQFVKIYGLVLVSENQIPNILSSLIKISKSTGSSNLNVDIQTSLDVFRTNANASVASLNSGQGDASNFLMNSSMNVPREVESDSDFLEKTELLMRDWINLYHSNTPPNKVFHIYVQSMNQQGILKTDDSITRFFRLSTELCVDSCYRLLSQQPQNNGPMVLESRTKCFKTLDAFAHLIVMLVKNSGSNNGSFSESTPKINLLNKVLNIIANVALQDQELRNEEFQHLPYYRILIVLLMELTLGPNNLGLPSMNNLQMGFPMNPNQVDPLYETIQLQVLNAFCQALKVLKPSKAPSFAFAWLDFIGHRVFMEKCLNGPGSNNNCISTKGWSFYAPLLIEIIKFEAPFLRNVELPQSIDLLFKGTLKVLLVLLHDFPEFLCEYCYELCDAIPPNAIQMRNLVLSAFPRNMRLPDPFTPNLKIDSLPEITQPPKGTSPTLQLLANVPFRQELDSYIRTRSPVTFLCDLRGYLQNPNSSDGTRYNIPLMNALVLFVGQAAIQAISPKHISMTTIAHSSHMDIFQNLAVDLDTEGRYIFLNAIANQLRYPNSHTHYFSCTLLYIFAESNQEAIQEQITRVLLERLIVNRPHPWGLLVTFIELIKNQQFKFWNHEFVRCAPEIEKLFESVARSCMQQQQQRSQGSTNSGQVTGELVRSQSS